MTIGVLFVCFSGEMRTQEENFLLGILQVDEGFCEEHVGQTKGQKKSCTSAALVRGKIIDTVSGASL